MVDPAGDMARTAAVVPVVDAGALDLEVAPTADEFAPGQMAGIEVTTSEGGEPVAASVGLDIVDESVQPIEASSGGSSTRDYYDPQREARTGPVESSSAK